MVRLCGNMDGDGDVGSDSSVDAGVDGCVVGGMDVGNVKWMILAV